jgi:hypothetical protein
VVPAATYRLLFVLVLLAHDQRRIRHIVVTAHPTAAWTAQRRRHAFCQIDFLVTTTGTVAIYFSSFQTISTLVRSRAVPWPLVPGGGSV